jgi:hypothetical protein
MTPQKTPDWMRPLWVRALLIVVPAVWGAVELFNGNQFWGLMFVLVAAYGAWLYLIQYKPPEA